MKISFTFKLEGCSQTTRTKMRLLAFDHCPEISFSNFTKNTKIQPLIGLLRVIPFWGGVLQNS
jgi:hypothetical protein